MKKIITLLLAAAMLLGLAACGAGADQTTAADQPVAEEKTVPPTKEEALTLDEELLLDNAWMARHWREQVINGTESAAETVRQAEDRIVLMDELIEALPDGYVYSFGYILATKDYIKAEQEVLRTFVAFIHGEIEYATASAARDAVDAALSVLQSRRGDYLESAGLTAAEIEAQSDRLQAEAATLP